VSRSAVPVASTAARANAWSKALWEDMKAAPSVGLKHRKAWRRLAVVTNKEWMRRAIGGFGWLYPGEMRVFELDELEAATRWVADASPTGEVTA
jgi:stage II sporulation SpoAA-like protein